MNNQKTSYFKLFLFVCAVIVALPLIIFALLVTWNVLIMTTPMMISMLLSSWKVILFISALAFIAKCMIKKKKETNKKDNGDFYVYKRDMTDKEKVELIRRKLS